MIRLIIAIAVGIVIAAGGAVAAESILNTAATGTPTNASVYQYGSH